MLGIRIFVNLSEMATTGANMRSLKGMVYDSLSLKFFIVLKFFAWY
jgi:hypothetical protein